MDNTLDTPGYFRADGRGVKQKEVVKFWVDGEFVSPPTKKQKFSEQIITSSICDIKHLIYPHIVYVYGIYDMERPPS